MTDLQQQVYFFLLRFFEENQRYPTYREIQDIFKFKSISQVQSVLKNLKKGGYVTWEPYRPTTFRLPLYRAKLEKIESA